MAAALFAALLAKPIPAQTPPPETEAQAEPKPKPPPRPPEGILPVGEVARIRFAPSERPRAVFHQSRLFLVTASGSVEARDAASAEFQWKLGLPGEKLFPPVLHRVDPFEVLLSSSSGRLYVVDAETGEIRRESPLSFELALAPLVDLPLLYLGTPAGDVVAFDVEKGRERFRAQVGEPSQALASSGGLVVVSGSERTLAAIDPSSGLERFRLRGRSGFYAPAIASDRLYVGNDAGDFYCLALEDGDVRFRWATGASIRFAPLVEERFVFVASFGNDLYAYQASGGAERYRVRLPGRPASGPVRFGRRLAVVTYDGVIVEIDPQKGAVGKTYPAPGELASPPAFLPASPSLGAEWYASHRIALSLRTGEVLLLGHRPEEEEEEEPSERARREPTEPKPPQEDSLSRK
jgi:outer membrane protein assembly factor BamB